MRVLHLTDLHVRHQPGPDDDGVDAREVLDGLLHDLRRERDLDLVVVTGDVADDGSVEAYRHALEAVGAYAAERGAAHVWCPGNHDARGPFAQVLGSGHHGRAAGQPGPQGTCAAASDVDGLRVVTLDSLVPGEVPGRLDQEQLAWLRDVLAAPAERGTLVALHHPPVALTPQQAADGLQDPHELAAALDGSDVRAVLCGHFHAQVAGRLGDAQVWAGPGVVTRIDLTAPPTVARGVRGAAATVVDWDAPFGPLFSVRHARDPRAGEQLYLADARTWQDVPTEDG